jgi:4-amino-4-deoxy-L-arabinose transferase-like glycosyltransferase
MRGGREAPSRRMTNPNDERGPRRRRRTALAFVVVAALGFALYAADVPGNPPGFYIDESSIAYNAHLVATKGLDEHGTRWPLFFRAFGDYKNPVYVYLLAAVFRVTGPSILAARLLSAAFGVAASLALGLLGTRVSGRRRVGLLVALSALLTPWLFELSRVVIEVSMYPFAVALFLLCAWRAAARRRMDWGDAACLAASLALLTYSYSVGRLLGPLLALGLALFWTRARAFDVPRVWLLYALSLVPLYAYARQNPGALTGRFQVITYVTPQSTYADIARDFVKHYFGNLDVRAMLLTGDPNENQIASIYGVGVVLAATFALALAGAWLALRKAARGGERRWWLFVFYGLAASLVPASLTNEYFHMLRLSAVPVFVLVLTVPAFAWLFDEGGAGGRRRRTLLFVLVALTLAQGSFFQWQYHGSERAPRRVHLFDHDYAEKILAPALANGRRPILLADALAVPGYIQAYWHATLRGVPATDFVRLAPDASPPLGSLVISTEENCPRCEIIGRRDPYVLYTTVRPAVVRKPLAEGGFRTSLRVLEAPGRVRAKEKATLRVVVKNLGQDVWPARERSGGKFQVSLGNHWLDAGGGVVTNDDGRAALLRDLGPGEETELTLVVNAPRQPGDYLIELDLLQEGVSWFGLKGSPTTRLPVKVE